MSNKIGDRHRPVVKTEKHHAKLVVDSAKTISDFLLSSMEYQASRTGAFQSKLLGILDSKKRLFGRDELLADKEIRDLFGKADKFLLRAAKNHLIRNHEISSYRQSDIFFAALYVLFEELTCNDILVPEAQNNSQMAGWDRFIAAARKVKPDIVPVLPEEKPE